jgi:hypothetical protein
VIMPKCHICGKFGLYTEMIDYTVYSIHPRCEHTQLSTSHDVKEFKNCAVCQETSSLPSRKELRKHLIDNHSKEALADLIVDSIY